MKLTLEYNRKPYPLTLTPAGNRYTVEIDGVHYLVEITYAQNGRLDIRLSASESAAPSAPVRLSASESAAPSAPVRLSASESADPSASVRLSASESADPSVFTAHVTTDGPRRWVTIHGRTCVITKAASNRRAGAHAHHATGEIVAPMPGQIRAVNISEGDPVTRVQTLLLLEAMKM